MAAESGGRAISEDEKQLDMPHAKPKARSSSSTGKGGRKRRGKARQDAEPHHAEPKQSDYEASSSEASSCAVDSLQELGHGNTRWPFDGRFSQATSGNTSLDQYVGENSLSPECAVKVCRFHQPWKTDRRIGHRGPKFCDAGANCQDLHLGEALATKKALA